MLFYSEFRTLIIEMVIATDMSTHFQQVKTLKTLLSHTEFSVDKQKGLSYILHSADISHPSKMFPLHQRWTLLLMEEFFRQVRERRNSITTTTATLLKATFSAMLHRQLNVSSATWSCTTAAVLQFVSVCVCVCLHLLQCIRSCCKECTN